MKFIVFNVFLTYLTREFISLIFERYYLEQKYASLARYNFALQFDPRYSPKPTKLYTIKIRNQISVFI